MLREWAYLILTMGALGGIIIGTVSWMIDHNQRYPIAADNDSSVRRNSRATTTVDTAMKALWLVISGNPATNGHLLLAGLFVFVWFAIDVLQFSDWVSSKLNPQQSAICLPVTPSLPWSQGTSPTLPLLNNNAKPL
jgi:hypothetical protein